MASTQLIKQRIASVKGTRQITKAMQLVAASKLRRAQTAVDGPREFSRLARELLTRLRQLAGPLAYDLFIGRPVKTRLIVAIASDRTLAGAYNANVCKRLLHEIRADQAAGVKTEIIAIGRQVAAFATRLKGYEVLGVYQNLPDQPDPNQVRAIIAPMLKAFRAEAIDAADLLYTHFYSAIRQEVTLQRVLPAGFEATEVSADIQQAEFEPSIDDVLERAVQRLVEVQLLQAMHDAAASEHAMRMLAMQSATDNASDIIDDLTLVFNNARQASITQELAEITGGAEAMA